MQIEMVHSNLDRLTSDGLIEDKGGSLQPTRKWQSAMARAALRLYQMAE